MRRNWIFLAILMALTLSALAYGLVGLVTASPIASGSAASFLPRLT